MLRGPYFRYLFRNSVHGRKITIWRLPSYVCLNLLFVSGKHLVFLLNSTVGLWNCWIVFLADLTSARIISLFCTSQRGAQNVLFRNRLLPGCRVWLSSTWAAWFCFQNTLPICNPDRSSDLWRWNAGTSICLRSSASCWVLNFRLCAQLCQAEPQTLCFSLMLCQSAVLFREIEMSNSLSTLLASGFHGPWRI